MINRSQAVIDDTHRTLERFEATGLASELHGGHEPLHAIPDSTVRDQKAQMPRMLDQ